MFFSKLDYGFLGEIGVLAVSTEDSGFPNLNTAMNLSSSCLLDRADGEFSLKLQTAKTATHNEPLDRNTQSKRRQNSKHTAHQQPEGAGFGKPRLVFVLQLHHLQLKINVVLSKPLSLVRQAAVGLCGFSRLLLQLRKLCLQLVMFLFESLQPLARRHLGNNINLFYPAFHVAVGTDPQESVLPL